MNGLELAEAYYNEYGRKMLAEDFPDLTDSIAVGLLGSGSECMGYDDGVSQDHDFEPGFCIFVGDDIDSRTEFRLERAYAKLPDEFTGFKRQRLSPVGGNRHGVIRLSDFVESRTGSKTGELTMRQWLFVQEQLLIEITNGKVFVDESGMLTNIRDRLKYMPEDIRNKKLAGHLLMMAQAGQYNYYRAKKRGDEGAVLLALHEFAMSGIHVVYLLNNRYMPYYKWAFRGMRDIGIMSKEADTFVSILKGAENAGDLVEGIAEKVIAELKRQGLTDATCGDLEKHAYSVNDRVKSGEIRNMSIFAGV